MNRIVKSLMFGAAACLLAGNAMAAQRDINFYGASAQFKVWSAAAAGFLTSELGCASSNVFTASAASINSREQFVAICRGNVALTTNDSVVNGTTGTGVVSNSTYKTYAGDTVVIRYTAHASAEGINSVQGVSTTDSATVAAGCTAGQRLLPNLAQTTFSAGSVGTIAGTACADVTVGTSDVNAATFNQSSVGANTGPCGGSWQNLTFKDLSIPTSTNYYIFKPLVVPFAFFANANPTSPVPFSNLSRLQAVALFSGNVYNWNQFKPDLDGDGTSAEEGLYLANQTGGDSLPVVLCLRHAGSGTHATLDAAVMRKDASLVTEEVASFEGYEESADGPFIYFNQSSGNERTCIGGTGCSSTSPWYSGIGAVGYADADAIGSVADNVDVNSSSYGHVKRLTYNGVSATRDSIKYGNYDFWSNQWAWMSKTDSALYTLVNGMMSYAGRPATINLLGSTISKFWAGSSEMTVSKSSDYNLPSF